MLTCNCDLLLDFPNFGQIPWLNVADDSHIVPDFQVANNLFYVNQQFENKKFYRMYTYFATEASHISTSVRSQIATGISVANNLFYINLQCYYISGKVGFFRMEGSCLPWETFVLIMGGRVYHNR